jgi:hypothetical protein
MLQGKEFSMRARRSTKFTITVPEAGRRYFGLSRNGSYSAAKRGEIPTIRIGERLYVPIKAVERMLDQAGLADRLEPDAGQSAAQPVQGPASRLRTSLPSRSRRCAATAR